MRRYSRTFLSTTFLAGFSALTLAGTAMAQPSKPQDKKTDAAVQSSPIVVNQQINDWDVQCVYPTHQANDAVQSCTSHQNLSVKNKDGQGSTMIASIALAKTKNASSTRNAASDSFKIIIITPLGFSLQKPVSLTPDHGKQIDLAWVACSAQGCLATQTLNAAQKKDLQTNANARLVLPRINNTTLTVNFDLNHIEQVMNTMDTALNKKAP